MSRKTTFRFTAVDDAALDQVFARHAGARRFAYNQCRRFVEEGLEARNTYPGARVPWSGYDLINAFNSWKVSEAAGRVFAVDSSGSAEVARRGPIWRSEVCSGVFEEAAVDLGRALAAYSESRRGLRRGPKVGFPTYKRKTTTRRSFRLRNKMSGTRRPRIRLGEGGPRSITLPVIGMVKLREDTRALRRLLRPSPDGSPKARIWFVTVASHRGRWVLAVTVEAPDLHPARRHQDGPRRFVGLDLGLSALVVGARSDRTEVERIPAPEPLGRVLPRVRRANRVLSRRRPGSARRHRARTRLARLHAQVADRRDNFCHELTSRLVKTHDGLCVESMAVANLMANHHLARAIGDASWGRLYRQLDYKAAWYGTQVVVAPRFFPSTKTCSACGALKDTMRLSERVFACGDCGLTADRDTNAAANLAAWAEAEVSSQAQAPDPEERGRVINARRGTGAGRHLGDGETGPETPRRKAGRKREPATSRAG